MAGLHSVHDPIPKEAAYASPLYLLTAEENDRLQSISDPHAVSGKCIAKELQDKCETKKRVLYPILIESDDGDSWQEQQEWIREFIEEHLPVSPYDCLLFHSGKRSVHAHVPLFTTGDGLDYLREVAKDFHGELDEKIYSRKRQFRLPGVRHDETGYPKVSIEWEWDDARIGKAIVTGEPDKPETYADLLRETFGPDVLDNPTAYLWEPDSGEEVKSEAHPWEPGQPEPDGETPEKWKAYNRHAFCPHAKAGNGIRSIALVEVIGGACCHEGKTLIPTFLWTAVSCTGERWQIEGYSPISLSESDYRKIRKMGVEPGDDLLIIGGKSHRSRIYRLDREQQHIIQVAISEEWHHESPNTRADTLATIESCGFDPGNPGLNGGPRTTGTDGNRSGPSRATVLQEKAESRGIHSLSHQERLHVGNRLLRTKGVDGAIDWYRRQFGGDFDRDVTLKHLKSIADRFSDLPDIS